MNLTRNRRSPLTPKEIDAKYGWKPTAAPSTIVGSRQQDPTNFHVQVSVDEGWSWTTKVESSQPAHALRLARQVSAADSASLYRVFNVVENDALLHFRGGMAVYENRGWR